MKKNKLILLVILLLISIFSAAQDINVKSFELLDNDLTAITPGTEELDNNGNKAALIKVVTTQSGFSFDCGILGIVKTKHQTSEYWVYVPAGVRHITIKHPQLGILRDYTFPIPIEAARTYEMVLTTGQVQTVIQQDAGGQYLIMKVSPQSAIVKIDDIEAQSENGVISKFLPYGKHTYSVSDPFYKDDQGIIEIGDERKDLNIVLRPNYGILRLSSKPENGAKVMIDGEDKIAGVTPFTTGRLINGKHLFRFQLSQYSTKDTTIIVDGNGSTKDVTVTMSANFGYVIITAPENSYIYINNENKGRSYWSGRLAEGMYFIEAKKDSYRTTSKNINVQRGQNLNIELDAPIPIHGMLNINSHPVGASVYIDDSLIGTTPNIFKNILIGQHKISLKNEGYQDYSSNINIEEGKVLDVDAQLKEENKYVDMGLSVYWGTCNIGADSPSDFGNFYAWGETEPKSDYLWENYKYGNSRKITKFIENHTKVLDYNGDVARIMNGEGWHIPTIGEWIELRTKCKWEWSYKNGVSGYKVTGPNGNYIFLPAAGYYYGEHGYKNKGIAGEYWTSTMYSDNPTKAINFKMAKEEHKFYETSICCGLPIRPAFKVNYRYYIDRMQKEYSSTSKEENKKNEDMESLTPSSKKTGKVAESDPITVPEEMASFNGNVNEWLSQHLKYPDKAAKNGIQGKVIVKFVVKKNGSVSQPSIIRSVDPYLDREALRCVKSMPKWKPGKEDGKPAEVWYSLPITFKLQ